MNSKIDILNRQPLVDRLIDLVRLIADSGRGCTFSLDGKWGSGKSFVLEMFENQLGLFQDPDAAGDRYVIFHYNCWQYDFYEEPALAIVAAIRNQIAEHTSLFPQLPMPIRTALETAGDVGKELLGSFMETRLGCNPIALMEKAYDQKSKIEKKNADENEFDTYYKFKEMLDLTKEQLTKMAADKPIILVVDELDRCMPDYAIKVLERLHHFFDENNKIIVLLAVDREQLDRTVHQIFGAGDSEKENQMCAAYLRKFINFSVSLDTGTIAKGFWERYAHILSSYDVSKDRTELFLDMPISLFAGIDARTQERVMERMITLHKLSFKGCTSVAVLYFELIYQAIMVRDPTLDSFAWFIRMGSQENKYLRNVIGQQVWEYLKELVMSVSERSVRIIGNTSYKVLEETPLGIAVWLFASLVEKPTARGTCAGFTITGASQYDSFIDGAQRYHQLMKLIR